VADRTPVIVEALRTPIGTAGRALAAYTADDLAARVLAPLASAARAPVEQVILGNCMGPGGNLARVAALRGGLDEGVPALTVDRQCASGLAAVSTASALVRAGDADVVLAGGVESASTAPWRYWPPDNGGPPRRYERAPFAPKEFGDPDMGLAADLLGQAAGVTRSEQDAYAARSHARALATGAAGGFTAETVAVGGATADDRPRRLTVDTLAKLRPAFREDGTVTVGNSCGVSDGAAAVTVVAESLRARHRVPGLRVLASATAGTDPRLPGRSPVPAVRAALSRAGVRLVDIDVVEVNEAFAAQVLACCRELDLDPSRVCPEGGALALGHPWGASGAVLLVRLFTQLVRSGRGGLGLAAIAAGGGQGVAMVVEAVA
jgi:acetyl-CoA C-acetyltransferase